MEQVQPSIDQMNEVLALFMGYEKIYVGYFGSKGDGSEYDETEWQKENEDWMDKVGMDDIGHYIVDVKNDKWYEWDEVKYHTSWDWLMPVVKKCHDIVKEKEIQYPEYKGLDNPTGWRSWSYRYVNLSTDIKQVYDRVYQFIQWYNQQKQSI